MASIRNVLQTARISAKPFHLRYVSPEKIGSKISQGEFNHPARPSGKGKSTEAGSSTIRKPIKNKLCSLWLRMFFGEQNVCKQKTHKANILGKSKYNKENPGKATEQGRNCRIIVAQAFYCLVMAKFFLCPHLRSFSPRLGKSGRARRWFY